MLLDSCNTSLPSALFFARLDKTKAETTVSRSDASGSAFLCALIVSIITLTLCACFFQTYLKEILNEVCNYNLKNPHRNMYELKPEYRHYKEDED